jgi:hypothetical protein
MMTTITHPQLPKIKGFHWNPRCRLVAPRVSRNCPDKRILSYNAVASEAYTRTRTGATEPVLEPAPSAAATL